MRLFKAIWYWLQRRPKFRIFKNQEMAVEAFRYKGVVYYHFSDDFKLPAGRAMSALAIYEELKMRTNREYLEKHVRANEIILSDPKKIDISVLAIMNNNLKERLELAPFPDHIFKLASVQFFDETESPYSYDYEYNRKKIEKWKKDPEMLSFFLRTRFQDLIPFGNLLNANANTFFQVAGKVDQFHQDYLTKQLFKAK